MPFATVLMVLRPTVRKDYNINRGLRGGRPSTRTDCIFRGFARISLMTGKIRTAFCSGSSKALGKLLAVSTGR